MKNLIATISFGLITASAQSMVWQSDGTPQNIQFIHDNPAVDGDTITIPTGAFSWTTGVNVTKGITFQGQTTVSGDHTTWSVASPPPVSDQTVLVDNITGGAGFFNCTALPGQNLRITGITFKGGTGTGANGPISVGGSTDPAIGSSHTVRLDHLHFTGQIHRGAGIEIYAGTRGVQDHIVYDQADKSNPQNFQNKIKNGSYPYGDIEWSRSSGFGTDDFWFIEDNWVNNDSGVIFSAAQGWDGHQGSKYILRYCILFNVEILCHGTENSRQRGGRAQEIYNCEYHWDHSTSLDGIRSGTLLVHDNTFVGIQPSGWNQQTYRMIYNYGGSGPFAGWGGANGTSPWDVNDPAGVFDSGTVTGWTNSGNSGTLTDSSKNWTPDQYFGYSLRRPSDGATMLIAGNTATTLNARRWGDPCCIVNWTVGQPYEIRKVLQSIDQPGAGASDLISGDNPTPAWPHQVREGNYSWNNIHTASGAHVNFTSSTPNLIAGRDYFQDTPMPGYTPYCYPHPLVSGVPCALGTPTPTPTPTATPALGLVAAYGFNEGSGTVVNDASGNGNNGTINGATWTTSGKYGNALNFNGSNALVTINNAASLQLTTGMTLEAWVYPTVTGPWWGDVIYKGNDNYYLEGTSYPSGFPAMGGTLPNAPPLYGTAVLALNTWAHLAATYDGATMRLYVNGVQVASRAQTGTIVTSTNPLQIGGDSIYGQYFTGRIDDVRIYNRALSAAQIQSDMNTPL
jgi:hypothetical protein